MDFTFLFLFIVLIIVIILSVFLFFLYRNLFVPDQKLIALPQYNYHDLYLPIGCRKGRFYKKNNRPTFPCLNVWYFNSYKDANTVLYFHGNVGNISHRDYVMNICHKFKLNLLLIDMRGFGNSNSHPTPNGICEDAEICYLFLAKQIEPEKIIVWGESLGGALAVHVASQYKCRSLILLATFSSLDDIARYKKEAGRWMSTGLSKLLELTCNRLPNKEWIGDVDVPLLILHSKTDDVIPYECAKILYKAAKKSPCKRLLTIKGFHSSPDISEHQLCTLFLFCDVNLNYFCPRSFTETRDDIKEAGKRHFAKYHTQKSLRKRFN